MKRGVLALMIAGLVIQIAALALSGTRDVFQFKTWAMTTLDRRLVDAYSYDLPVAPTGVSPIPDYPPLSVVTLTASARVAAWIEPDVTRDSRLLTVCVKAPLLVLQIAACWIVWRLAQRTPEPVAVALAFWLNPAFILNGPVLGYLDLLCWLPGVGAIVAALVGRAGSAGALLAVAVLVKPQGLFFVLPVAAALWPRPTSLARAALVAATIVAIAFLPFVLATPGGVWTSMITNFREDLLSGDALNLWWLVSAAGFVLTYGSAALGHTFGSPSVSTFIARAGVDPRMWTAAATIAAALWAFWRVRGRPTRSSVLALGAFAINVYFVAAIAVHENHLVYALPLMGLAALSDARYRTLYLAASALVTFNLLVFQGLGSDFAVLPRTGAFLPLTVLGAIGSGALLVAHARAFREVTAAARAAQGPRSADPAP
ncbi:MAG TPA: hypothetical protein VJN96_11485 [Vicinamibacterales bacterium]|nr:hypothetical protein [Vicinamibacterales bacterium]